jgi:hypothetical protein
MGNRNLPVRRVLLAVAGGAIGLAVSGVVVLNLHILSGMDEGYAASPREIWSRSVLLAVTDIALLMTGALWGVGSSWRRSGRASRPGQTDTRARRAPR